MVTKFDVSGYKFQSTHPRRVRQKAHHQLLHLGCFNPRTHVGCDNLPKMAKDKDYSFNPRTHVGCDSPPPCPLQAAMMFQSTHPRRVRHPALHARAVLLRFNPRTHVGCDILLLVLAYCSTCFNPRTHVGCDEHSPQFFSDVFSFNPRTHVGCDLHIS